MRPITATETEQLQLVQVEDPFNTPISTFDILAICREYSKLGYQMQQQVETLTELGIQDAINSRAISAAALPHIKFFYQQVIRNPLFGDAVDQAAEIVRAIEDWQEANPNKMTN